MEEASHFLVQEGYKYEGTSICGFFDNLNCALEHLSKVSANINKESRDYFCGIRPLVIGKPIGKLVELDELYEYFLELKQTSKVTSVIKYIEKSKAIKKKKKEVLIPNSRLKLLELFKSKPSTQHLIDVVTKDIENDTYHIATYYWYIKDLGGEDLIVY
jgi:hypothetical protein